MSQQFKTTAAYLSGGVCGPIWWPAGAMCGKPLNVNLRREFDRLVGDTPNTFAEVLEHILMEQGGDFQSAAFTADTVIRVERRAIDGAGKYRVHVWEREVSALPDCADWVNTDCYVGDFMGDDE